MPSMEFTHELLSSSTPVKTGEQLVHIDLKRLLSKRLFLFQNDNYTKTKHGNNKQNSTMLTCRLFNV